MSSFIRNRTITGHDLTPSERDQLLTLLCEEGLYDLQKLLQWLVSLRHSDFWNIELKEKELNYSPAQALYIEEVYAPKRGISFDTTMRVMAELMWEKRSDAPRAETWGEAFTPAMDAALMLLVEHIEDFKVLHLFDGDKFRTAAVPLDQVMMYVELIENQYASPEAADFALEWLSFHLPYYLNEHRKNVPKSEAEKRQSGASSGGAALPEPTMEAGQ